MDNCRNCGAPSPALCCAYCGTRYRSDAPTYGAALVQHQVNYMAQRRDGLRNSDGLHVSGLFGGALASTLGYWGL